MNAHIRKAELVQMNNLMMHLSILVYKNTLDP